MQKVSLSEFIFQTIPSFLRIAKWWRIWKIWITFELKLSRKKNDFCWDSKLNDKKKVTLWKGQEEDEYLES